MHHNDEAELNAPLRCLRKYGLDDNDVTRMTMPVWGLGDKMNPLANVR